MFDLAAAGMPAHGFEERRHALRIEAGAREDAEADAIGFGFVRAREADLLLDREALRRRHAGHRRVAAASGCADEDGGEHRRSRHQARAALRRDAACDVSLRDVRDFVREHARELALVLRFEQQPAVDADEAAGQREGVDLLSLTMKKLKRCEPSCAWLDSRTPSERMYSVTSGSSRI